MYSISTTPISHRGTLGCHKIGADRKSALSKLLNEKRQFLSGLQKSCQESLLYMPPLEESLWSLVDAAKRKNHTRTEHRMEINSPPSLSKYSDQHPQRAPHYSLCSYKRPPEANNRSKRDSTSGAFRLSRSIVSPPINEMPCSQSNPNVVGDGHNRSVSYKGEHFMEKHKAIDVTKLEQCFLCDLCLFPMRDPHISTVCSHSYCRGCIAAVADNGSVEKRCPVDNCGTHRPEGFLPTSLGPHPFSDTNPTIIKDSVLSDLIEKIFRRSHASAEAEEAEDVFIPEIQLPPSVVQETGSIRTITAIHCSASRLEIQPPVMEEKHKMVQSAASSSPNEYMTVAIFPIEGEGDVIEIEDNYFHLPASLSVCKFRLYLEMRFHLGAVQLFCHDNCVSLTEFDSMELMDICDEFWSPFSDIPGDVFTLLYRHHPNVDESSGIRD